MGGRECGVRERHVIVRLLRTNDHHILERSVWFGCFASLQNGCCCFWFLGLCLEVVPACLPGVVDDGYANGRELSGS